MDRVPIELYIETRKMLWKHESQMGVSTNSEAKKKFLKRS